MTGPPHYRPIGSRTTESSSRATNVFLALAAFSFRMTAIRFRFAAIRFRQATIEFPVVPVPCGPLPADTLGEAQRFAVVARVERQESQTRDNLKTRQNRE